MPHVVPRDAAPGKGAALDRIFMIARPEMHPFLLSLARLLGERHGSRLVLHFGTEDGALQFANEPDAPLFASVRHGNPLYVRCFDEIASEEEVYARGRTMEEWLGTTINRLIQADRHFGRGHALGGFHHPRSRFSELTTNAQVAHAVCETQDYWRRVLEEERPTLILSGDQYLEAVASRMGIPIRFVAGSRYKNYCYWSDNGMFEVHDLKERFDRASGRSAGATADVATPYLAHMRMRTSVGARPRLRKAAKDAVRLAARWGYWRVRGYSKAKGYYPTDEIMLPFRQYRDFARLTGPICWKLSDLEGRPFVFYPLQTEPEASLQRLSPEFTFQQAAIASIARDLPAGVLLAVKDTHFALGRRPREFYRQIVELKNVVLLDINEYGPTVVKAANAVIVISGTPGFEAAVMGKPVICIGRHNIFGFLDHVRQVEDIGDLRPLLKWALSESTDRAKAAADGACFLNCLLDMSFDMEGYDYLSRTGLTQRSVEDAYEKLVATL